MLRTPLAKTALQPLLRVARLPIAKIATPTRPFGQASSVRTLSSSFPRWADAATPNSSIADPAVKESQVALEEGTTLLEAGDFKGAQACYERSNSIKPSSTAYFNLGVCLFSSKDLSGAITAFEQSLKLSPQSADAHTNLASAWVMSEPARPDLAVEHLQKAAELDPDDGEVFFNLGAVLEATERLEEAVKAYTKAKDLGIARAEQNMRNCVSKVTAARLATPPPSEKDEEQK